MFFKSNLIFAFLLFSLLLACHKSDPASEAGSQTKPPGTTPAEPSPSDLGATSTDKFNSPEQIAKPVVVMISIDGFRSDYLEKYKPTTLLSWANEGVRAEGLRPSFPTLTFPNHITLVTGLRPGHHGIVSNKFFDKKRKQYYSMGDSTSVNDGTWYHGIPLWAAAEKEGMLSATAFWVGSEARIANVDPAYLKPYDGDISNEQRVRWVMNWLSLPPAKKPHFIGLYFSDVDSAGHVYGPDSAEVQKAIIDIDTQLGLLKKFAADKKMDVQFVLVSDHGMRSIDKTVDITSVSALKGFQTSGQGAVVHFYSDDSGAVDQAYQQLKKMPGEFDVYKGSELPVQWQLDDPDRRGDLVVVGQPGVYIGFKQGFAPKPLIGSSYKATHGWELQTSSELQGLFIANGSLFKKGLKIKSFDNVHVYPLITQILKLNPQQKIDGEFQVLEPILR